MGLVGASHPHHPLSLRSFLRFKKRLKRVRESPAGRTARADHARPSPQPGILRFLVVFAIYHRKRGFLVVFKNLPKGGWVFGGFYLKTTTTLPSTLTRRAKRTPHANPRREDGFQRHLTSKRRQKTPPPRSVRAQAPNRPGVAV